MKFPDCDVIDKSPISCLGGAVVRSRTCFDLRTLSKLERAALADASVQQLLAGKTIVKTIVVPGRMVNFVVK